MNKLIQYTLENVDGKRSMVTFLDGKLKIGDIVTLKDFSPDKERWRVAAIGQEETKEELNKKRKWDNDKYDKVNKYI